MPVSNPPIIVLSQSPTLHNLKGWSGDWPQGTGSAPTLGVEYIVRLTVVQDCTLANIHFVVPTTAGTSVVGEVGVRSAAGVLLGRQTSIGASSVAGFGNAGWKRIPLVAESGRSLAVTAGTDVLGCLLVASGTPPQPQRVGTNAIISDINLDNGDTVRGGTIGSGLSALPGSITPTKTGGVTVGTVLCWCAVS